MEIPWSEFRTFIHDLGLLRGLFAIFFLGMHAWVFALYNGRLQDRQKEIDRLAEENKEYRNRFTALLDKGLKIPKNLLPRSSSSPQRPKKSGRR